MKTLAFVLTLALGATAPASATSIQVVASTATPTSGELFTITIQALNLFDGFQPLDLFYGFGFDVVNTPDIGDPGSAAYQPGLLAPGLSFSLVPTLPADGTDVVGFGDITNPASEPLVLAVLTFMAGAPGKVALGATADLTELNAGLFHAVFDQGSGEYLLDPAISPLHGTTTVNIQAAAVPEASSFGLPLGLMALIGVRRFLRDR